MSQITIKISEKYLSLVPRPSQEEYKVLYESLYLNGQRENIIINQEGTVLDGHTRYDILVSRDIVPKYTVKEFDSKEEETLYVIDCNLARRHLNAYQKVKLVYSIYKIRKTGSGGNTRNMKKTGGASAIVGKTIGVSRNYVQMAAWLIENADETMKESLESGTITIAAAYKIKNPPVQPKTHTSNYDMRVQCPCCSEIFEKNKLRRVSD